MGEYRMRIAVCDDELQDLQTTVAMTKKMADQEKIPCELISYQNSAALLDEINNGKKYSLLLLDVIMKGVNGIELAAMLRARQNNTAVVFVSSNLEMALRGYEVSALRYLAKPLEEDKLREALLHCYRLDMDRQKLTLPTANGARQLAPADIIYAETWGRGVRLMLANGQEDVGMKISELEAILPKRQFVLCHRAYLVNLDYVQYIRYCELELKTGGVLPISKYRQNAIREKLMNYMAD